MLANHPLAIAACLLWPWHCGPQGPTATYQRNRRIATQQGGGGNPGHHRQGKPQLGIGDGQFGHHLRIGDFEGLNTAHHDAAVGDGRAGGQPSGVLKAGLHGPGLAPQGNALQPEPKAQAAGDGNQQAKSKGGLAYTAAHRLSLCRLHRSAQATASELHHVGVL